MNYLPLLLILTACHTPIGEELEKDMEHGIDVHLDIENAPINSNGVKDDLKKQPLLDKRN